MPIWLKKTWAWLKKYWGVVVGTAAAVVVGALAAGAYRRKATGLKAAIEVEQTLRRVENLRGQREELMRQDEVDEVRVKEIDDALEENRKAIVEARKRAEVPDDELADELARLGY